MNQWAEGKKLLVPFDFSPEAAEAIDSALSMAEAPEDVSVLHVAPDLATTSPEVVWQSLPYETREENLQDSFHRKFPDSQDKGLHFEVAFGHPAQRIVEYADEHDVDVIVMPSLGRTGVKRLLIGSVAERVVRLAHCPVLVLR